MKKILIIEDDIWISDSLKLYLDNSWFKTESHDEWLKAIEKIKKINPDLIIMDINLPWKDWIQITKDLRSFSTIPVIILTARNSEIDRIDWLEKWADDYIAKPFSPRELLARINTIIRRINADKEKANSKDLIEIMWVKINTNKKIVNIDWKNIAFTGNEYDILEKLFELKWWVLTRENIMKEIIGYDKYLYDRTIDTHIKNLRKKIWKKDFILTIRWEWYRINI